MNMIFHVQTGYRQKLSVICETHPRATPKRNAGGADRDRTGDPLLAKQVLSQLS